MIVVTVPGGVCKMKSWRYDTELTFHMHIVETIQIIFSFPGGLVVKDPNVMQDTWVEKTPWRRKWQPIPLFLPGEAQGQRNLVGYIP